MKTEDFELIELFHAYSKNTWYAVTVSYASIAYSHNRKDKYSHILFIVSCGFTISALMFTLKLKELVDKHPDLFDFKMKAICYIFIVAIIILLYISLDSIRTGYLKH